MCFQIFIFERGGGGGERERSGEDSGGRKERERDRWGEGVLKQFFPIIPLGLFSTGLTIIQQM